MARFFGNGITLGNVAKISNCLDPSSAQDVVTLNYLQTFVRGLTNKDAVRAASTANVTLTAPGASIDGVTLSVGDRVLLKNQTTASQNGIYIFQGSAATMTLAPDSTTGELKEGDTTYVAEGTVNTNTSWSLQASLTGWIQTGGVAAVYTAAASGGLQVSSNAFSVKLPASSGLIADSTGLYVDSSIVVRKYSANFGDGSATTFTITHNLGTKDVQVTVYDNTTNAEEDPDVTHASTTTITLAYAAAPASGGKRVVVHA